MVKVIVDTNKKVWKLGQIVYCHVIYNNNEEMVITSFFKLGGWWIAFKNVKTGRPHHLPPKYISKTKKIVSENKLSKIPDKLLIILIKKKNKDAINEFKKRKLKNGTNR